MTKTANQQRRMELEISFSTDCVRSEVNKILDRDCVLSYQVPVCEKEEFNYMGLKRDISLYQKAQELKARLSIIKSATSSTDDILAAIDNIKEIMTAMNNLVSPPWGPGSSEPFTPGQGNYSYHTCVSLLSDSETSSVNADLFFWARLGQRAGNRCVRSGVSSWGLQMNLRISRMRRGN